MRIAVAGSSGLIGRALIDELRTRGIEHVRLVRRESTAADEVSWNPADGTLDEDALGELTHIVNLAGAPVGKRWTSSYKDELRDSRVHTTRTLAKLIARRGCAIDLINGSAVGIYGDRPGVYLTETVRRGDTFLARLVADWEAACAVAERAGARVVKVRTGLVMSPDGGALEKMLPLIRAGVAGPLGSGEQIWPWISLTDEVGALLHLLESDVEGPVNLAAPAADTNAQVIKAIASAFGKRAIIPTPGFALKAALGEFAAEILASQQLSVDKLVESGYAFTHPDLGSMAAWLVDQARD